MKRSLLPFFQISFVLSIVILAPFFGKAQTTNEIEVHYYLLIGQSNMAGRGPLDTESKVINEQIIMLDSLNNWVGATDPVHFDKPKMVGVGPGYLHRRPFYCTTSLYVDLTP